MQHDFLMSITAAMPMKTIDIGGQPYLERYFAGYDEHGGQWWYHRFLRADAERHLHNHPWSANVMILRGSYVEEYIGAEGVKFTSLRYQTGATRRIVPQTTHRILDVEPNTWTLLRIEPGRLPTWSFIGDDGEREIRKTSPEDWHKDFAPRMARAA